MRPQAKLGGGGARPQAEFGKGRCETTGRVRGTSGARPWADQKKGVRHANNIL